MSRELVVGELAGRVIAGEYEPALVAWASGLASPGTLPRACEQPIIHLQRGNFDLPARAQCWPQRRQKAIHNSSSA